MFFKRKKKVSDMSFDGDENINESFSTSVKDNENKISNMFLTADEIMSMINDYKNRYDVTAIDRELNTWSVEQLQTLAAKIMTVVLLRQRHIAEHGIINADRLLSYSLFREVIHWEVTYTVHNMPISSLHGDKEYLILEMKLFFQLVGSMNELSKDYDDGEIVEHVFGGDLIKEGNSLMQDVMDSEKY